MLNVKCKKVRAATAAVLSLLTSNILHTAAHAAVVTPVYDVRFLGGQHFFDGDQSALSGNLNMTISPAIKFNDKWTLIPTYAGGYQGTRDVQELAGGGTLFQDSTGHGVTVKGVYSLSSAWKLKATTGAKYEFLRETKDESWGDGLFDYRKYTGGVEAEFSATKELGGRVAYDYYALDFPNYQSLESSQDDTLSRELAGKETLNSGNHLGTLGMWSPLPGGVKADLAFFYNQRAFSDQPVVNAAGSLTGTDRSDDVMAVSAGISRPWSLWRMRLVGELGVGYNATDSNQNHYDARKTVFLQDYYDYSQITVGPRVTAGLGSRPWIVSAGAAYNVRDYNKRPIQDGNGDYLTEKLQMKDITASVGLTYPLNKNFKARLAMNLGWSDSNMKYEKVFQYNYKIANYLMGFSYEY